MKKRTPSSGEDNHENKFDFCFHFHSFSVLGIHFGKVQTRPDESQFSEDFIHEIFFFGQAGEDCLFVKIPFKVIMDKMPDNYLIEIILTPTLATFNLEMRRDAQVKNQFIHVEMRIDDVNASVYRL